MSVARTSLLFLLVWVLTLTLFRFFPPLSHQEAMIPNEVISMMHMKVMLRCVLLLFPIGAAIFLLRLVLNVRKNGIWPPVGYTLPRPVSKISTTQILPVIWVLIAFLALNMFAEVLQISQQIQMIEIVRESFHLD